MFETVDNAGEKSDYHPTARTESAFDAFISYSQKADKPIAQALRSVLQTIGKPWWKARGLNVFLDATSLSAAPSLWFAIESRLSRSRYLILLASPQAAASKWVDKEVTSFIGADDKRVDKILIALTDGDLRWDEGVNDFKWDLSTPLCPSLRGRFRSEPLWVDLRAFRDFPPNKSNPHFLNAAIDLAATIRGVEKSDLFSDELNRRKRNLRTAYGIAVVLAALTVAAGTAAWYAVRNERLANIARDNALTVQSRFLADSARQWNTAGDYGSATALALEALPDPKRGVTKPLVLEAEIALYQSLAKLRERLVLRNPNIPNVNWTRARFSPDGATVLTADSQLKARLWDTTTGAEIAVLHDSRIRDVMGNFAATFSPDGKIIATANRNGLVLWDAATGVETKFIGGTLFPASIAFSPDGRRIATQSSDHAAINKTVRVWDTATGAELLTLHHDDRILSVAYSPDGTQLVTASADGTSKIWDAATGAQLAMLRDPKKQALSSAAFSPDGSRIVVGGNLVAWVWNVKAGTSEALPHGFAVMSAAFSPDGSQVITTAGSSIYIWDLSTVLASKIRIPSLILNNLASTIEAWPSPDGKQIVSSGFNGIARIWTLAAGLDPLAITARFQAPSKGGPEPHPRAVTSSRDGLRVLTISSGPNAANNIAHVWDTTSGSEIAVLRGGIKEIITANFSQNGRRGLTAWQGGLVRTWDAITGRPIHDFQHPGVKSASFSADGSRIVTAGTDALARVWDVLTGKEVLVLQGHQSEVTWADFSSDGKRIVTASEDSTVRTWDAERGTQLRILKGHEFTVFSAAFSPDHTLVVTSGADQTVRIWDAATGTEVARREKTIASSFLFSRDSKRLVASGSQVVVWDVATRAIITVIGLESTEITFHSAIFSDDEKRLLVAAGNGAALWDVTTGTKIVDFCCHSNKAFSAMFSRDGTRVVTVAADGTARLWRAFPTIQQLVDYARSIMPRELTPEQRKKLFLQ